MQIIAFYTVDIIRYWLTQKAFRFFNSRHSKEYGVSGFDCSLYLLQPQLRDDYLKAWSLFHPRNLGRPFLITN